MRDNALILEIGLVAAILTLIFGLLALTVGWMLGGAQRVRRRAEAPLSPGVIPDERHQHIASVSAR